MQRTWVLDTMFKKQAMESTQETRDELQVSISILRYLAATVAPLVLLFFTVMGVVQYLNAEIRLTENELQGVSAILTTYDGIISLQKIRGFSEIIARRENADRQRLESLQKQFIARISTPQWHKQRALFRLTENTAQLQKNAEKLFSTPLHAIPLKDRFQQYTQIIEGQHEIVQLISNRSNLILDREFDSYYMMDLIVNQLPQLIEFIGRARGEGSGIIASKDEVTEEERMLFKERLTAINLGIENITNAINIKLTAAPQLQEIIKPIIEQANENAKHFVDGSNSLIINSSIQLDAEYYFHDGTQVISAFHDAYRRIGDLLVAHLEQRLESHQKLQFFTILGTLFSSILIIYFINSFYRTNRAAFKKIERLSITDPLTKLYNRRHLYRVFPRELLRARRENKSFAFGILDIDHFKRYNDMYGHPEGDLILIRVTDILKDVLRRASDFVFRIGGEEFCFLVTAMDEEEIQVLLEQVRLRIMALKIEHKGNDVTPFLTVSIGLAYLGEVGDIKIEEIIKCGDDALYKAKDMGRNGWHLYHITTEPQEYSSRASIIPISKEK